MNLKSVFNILLVSALLTFVYSCGAFSKETRLIKEGNEIADKIESFRKEKGRLPDSLSEMGLKETEAGPIYYAKKSDTKYILWFGTELGESVTYDSETKKGE